MKRMTWRGRERLKVRKKNRKTYLPIQNVYPSRWHSVSKLMSIVLAGVVVVNADNVILVCNANQLNVDDDDCGEDDGDDKNIDGNRLDFLRTFIRLFIFKICSLLSRISRRFVKLTVTAAFESIFSI